jgi:pyruvate/2-oxoglutarate dehydrogenase complex dihydrolipoamide dehydrogenase (E3) component
VGFQQLTLTRVAVRPSQVVGPHQQVGAIAILHSGKKIPADTVMYSAGRQGASDLLKLEAAGLTADERGRIAVFNYPTLAESYKVAALDATNKMRQIACLS